MIKLFKKDPPYDSTQDTFEHIRSVQSKLGTIIAALSERAINHDRSKLESPEKETFDKMTPKLKGSTYGSPEYKALLDEMRPALLHHYWANRHHPEYFDHHYHTGCTGVAAIFHMNLIDLIEMYCDWIAASERHKDGDPIKSIETSAERFHLDHQLVTLFKNTLEIFQDKQSCEKGFTKQS
jgi:hypothetical protein